MTERIGKYLLAKTGPPTTRERLQCWEITTLQGDLLGVVGWFQGWRQYVFTPEFGSEFNDQCLRDIAVFLERCNKEAK